MQLVFITSPLVHWSIITFWLHPNLSMTSALLSDTLAAPRTNTTRAHARTHAHTHTRSQICMPATAHANARLSHSRVFFFCMHACMLAHMHVNATTHTHTHTHTHTNTKSHLQTDRHRHLASVWAEIILDQYNSVSEPKHKLGSCWKTLLHASSCLCVCVCVCFWGLPDGNEPHRPRPSLPLVFLSSAVLIGNGC